MPVFRDCCGGQGVALPQQILRTASEIWILHKLLQRSRLRPEKERVLPGNTAASGQLQELLRHFDV